MGYSHEKVIKSPLLLLLLSACSVYCNVTGSSSHKAIQDGYLDIALEFITKAKQNISTDYECTNCLEKCPECPKRKPFDCADVLSAGHNKSGVYEIWLMNRVLEDKPVRVYCDMDTDGGGYTVIQRRGDFGSPKDYFFKDWKSYKQGFGDIEKDFWLGNENIFALTSAIRSSVRFDLMDVEKNSRYALYDYFWITGSFPGYYLGISNYSGDAGDAMGYHNMQMFSTEGEWWSLDNCTADRKGGWWYTTQNSAREWGCNLSNLNGIYHKGKYDGNATKFDGITWVPWKGPSESLLWTEIKVRPQDFRDSLDI